MIWPLLARHIHLAQARASEFRHAGPEADEFAVHRTQRRSPQSRPSLVLPEF